MLSKQLLHRLVQPRQRFFSQAESASTLASLPVLLVGGGLGGLTLAQSLKRNGIPVKVFERDGAADQRVQGYRIRIQESGIAALKRCLPPDIFARWEETAAQNDKPSGRADARTGERDPSDAAPQGTSH